MSGLLNVGTRALQANQIALQTAGNNIANVNTPGYSRQSVVLQSVPGQNFGNGYIGKGVGVETIQRNFSTFLNRQSALASTTASADSTRLEKLTQLEGVFEGGSTGLGAAVSDMLNSFSDVASAPGNLTARTVVLTRLDETASRMRAASQSLDDLQQGVSQEITEKVTSVNNLAQSIANMNGQIARSQGSGQPANDLLDKRDQLVRDLNQYVQTTSIAADDGTVGIFLGGSQALVLGTNASTVSIVKDAFNDPLKSKLAIDRDGQSIILDEKMLGGGEVSGLLRFQNTDLAEGKNLLGRLALAIGTSMNDQQKLGLDLDGNKGADLFTLNALPNGLPATGNTGNASIAMAVQTTPTSGTSSFIASDYELTFSNATSGTVKRQSDGVLTTFSFTPGTAGSNGTFLFQNPTTNLNDLPALDGLVMTAPPATTTTSTAPAAGDHFMLKPFSAAANDISSAFSTPRSLAMASPVAGSMSTSNTGTLQQVSVLAHSNPALVTPLTLKFIGTNQYIRSDDANYANYPDLTGTLTQPTPYSYAAGQPIESSLTTPLTGWSATLKGSPKAGDTFTVVPLDTTNTADLKLNAGNASAMMGLRDKAMFDGAALTDGYAGLIAQIGTRAQSAKYSADVSSSIATSLEKDRTGVSGVNLDEEAAKLLQYQQAYQASAKMIQIAQSIFDTLIQTVGR